MQNVIDIATFNTSLTLSTMVSATSLVLSLPALASCASAFKAVQGHYGEYSTVEGFFKQDDNSTDVDEFDYSDNLGLYDNYTWSDFKHAIQELNDNAPLNTTYKVLFYARHAQGYHNAAQTYFGDDAWNCYYSLINGNGTNQWGPDASLTELGIDSANNNSDLIKSLIPKDFPLPQSFYSSPFTRAADTLVLTWNDLVLSTGYVSPIFKESLRETIGLHTCDQRRNREYLENRYPNFQFEANFQDEDILWTKDTQETDNGKYWRVKQFLDDVFTSDENTFISVTAHSGVGSALLNVISHRKFSLSTGAIMPLVIKRESRLDFVPVHLNSTVTVGPSNTAPTCSTSISTLPSSIAFSTSSVDEGYSVVTVTTVISATTTA